MVQTNAASTRSHKLEKVARHKLAPYMVPYKYQGDSVVPLEGGGEVEPIRPLQEYGIHCSPRKADIITQLQRKMKNQIHREKLLNTLVQHLSSGPDSSRAMLSKLNLFSLSTITGTTVQYRSLATMLPSTSLGPTVCISITQLFTPRSKPWQQTTIRPSTPDSREVHTSFAVSHLRLMLLGW